MRGLVRVCTGMFGYVKGMLRVCSGYVKGMLRVCEGYVEGMLRVC